MNYQPSRSCMHILLASLITLVVCAAVRAEDHRPVVAVSFKIGKYFFRGPAADHKLTVEREIAQEIATACDERMTFINWRKASTPDDPNAVASLCVNLVPDKQTALKFFPTYQLDLAWRFSGQSEWTDLPPLDDPIVYQDVDRPKSDPNKFRRHMSSKIDRCFRNKRFKEYLESDFTSHIPISRDIYPHASRPHFVLPVEWDLLAAGSESVVKAEFEVKENGDKGNAELKPESCSTDSTFTACFVEKLTCGSHKFSADAASQRFAPWFRGLFKSRDRYRTYVYMKQYVRRYNPNTLGALALPDTPEKPQ